jgi:hypothetical protein
MKLQSRLNTFGPLLAFAALLLASLACSFTGDLRRGGTLEFSLSEDRINDLLNRSTNNLDEDDLLLDEITQVDIQDGRIQVFGDYTDENGATQEGSYEITMAAEDGALVVEIVAVDIEGMTMDDPRVQQANEKIADALSEAAAQNQGEVAFTAVEVKDGEVSFTLEFNWVRK